MRNEQTNAEAVTSAQEVEWTRPNLYPKQLDAIFTPKRYAIIEASTKAGKTVGCLAWLIEQAVMGTTGHNYWWVAPSFRQAAIAYRRAKSGLTAGTYVTNETNLMIRLINGTMIWFISGEIPDNLYGEDVYACVIDEASRLREQAWFAIRSTLTATRGPIRIIGNVKGRKSWFYKLARKAQAGDPEMHYAKIIAKDAIEAKVIDEKEVADAKSVLPEAVFQELYNAEPSDDTGNPFGLAAIRACVRPVKVHTQVCCYGVDLAKSTDYTVIIGLDSNGDCCFYERFQKPWMETVNRIKTVVGNDQCLLDSTGVGDAVVEFIQRNYGSNFEGFKFSSTSKQQIMEGLAIAIQGGAISFPPEVGAEAEEFEYQYTRTGVTYSAPEGMHDDTVCALALANHKLAHLSGGVALLRHYQAMAAMAGQTSPDTKAPGVRPAPPATGPKSSAQRAYEDMLQKLIPQNLCSRCGKDLSGGNIISDGREQWHAACDTPAWSNASAPAFNVPDLDETAPYTDLIVQTADPIALDMFVRHVGANALIEGSYDGGACVIRCYMNALMVEAAIEKARYGKVLMRRAG